MNSHCCRTILATVFSALVWYGCDDDGPVDPPPPAPGLTVYVVSELPNDTLKFFAGDSVYFAVKIIVADEHGLAYPGQVVHVALSDPGLGYLEFVDPQLRDTTNSLGRVNCFFHSYARAGEQTITASAGGFAENSIVTIIEVERPNSGFVLASNRPHDTIYIAPDSVLIVNFEARFVDANGNPRTEFDGMFISSSATGGHLERFTALSNGQATSTWTFHDEYGTYQARIFGNWLDPFTMLPDTSG
ncbi:MAG: hypothetical protein IPG71_10235 [bacterium]|nr:hypothetical protein [bacterium]